MNLTGGKVNKRVTLELRGGLANQLFQWATLFKWARENGYDLVIDEKYVNRPKNPGNQLSKVISVKVARNFHMGGFLWTIFSGALPSAIYNKINWKTGHIKRPFSSYANDLNALSALRNKDVSSIRARGLFQDTNYLSDYRNEIRQVLTPAFEKFVQVNLSQYAGLHVRRGDYISNQAIQAAFGSCSESYYMEAIKLLDKNLPIVVFTDDRDWASSNLLPMLGRGNISLPPEADHFSDLYLLSRSSQIVLANSTFSWWAYFLSEASLVIAPSPWFDDPSHDQNLTGDRWILLNKLTGQLID